MHRYVYIYFIYIKPVMTKQRGKEEGEGEVNGTLVFMFMKDRSGALGIG